MSDNRIELHPHAEQLDQARAGVLDADTEAAVRAHLAQCPECRRQFAMSDAIKQNLSATDTALARELRLRRRSAIADAQTDTSRFPRRWSLAASVSALALGMTLYLGWHFAGSHNPAEPDLYTDVDFYLWLSQQDSERHADNPS